MREKEISFSNHCFIACEIILETKTKSIEITEMERECVIKKETINVCSLKLRKVEGYFMSPKRTDAHIIGDKAVDIVKRCLPENWIVRKQDGDDDYGIDIEIEMVSSDGEVSGMVFKGQVKGHRSMGFENGYYKKSLSTDKLKYWLRFKMPVILFEVDITKEEVYWVDIQMITRRVYSDLNSQDSKQISIRENLKLTVLNKNSNIPIPLIILIRKVLHDYNWLFTYDKVKTYFKDFVAFVEVWSKCRNYDFFMEMDYEDIEFLETYYKLTEELAGIFYIAIGIESFDTWREYAEAKWDGSFTYDVGWDRCKQILSYTLKLMILIKKIVCRLEQDYWAKSDFDFQSFVENFELPTSVDENELYKVLTKYSQ